MFDLDGALLPMNEDEFTYGYKVFCGENDSAKQIVDPTKFCGIETFLIENCIKLKDEKSNTKTLTYNDVIEKIKAINL